MLQRSGRIVANPDIDYIRFGVTSGWAVIQAYG
jgi:hypothetical protein